MSLLADLLLPAAIAAGLLLVLRNLGLPLGRFSRLPDEHNSGRLLLIFLFLLLALVGRNLLWSTFMPYDDEGYVLYSLKAFSGHGSLYEEVYTQYGPFYYQFGGLLHFLGLPFNHEASRWMNLLAWSGSALFLAVAVLRGAPRFTGLAIFTLCAGFSYLWPLISEPAHPGALICLSLSLLAWLGVERDAPSWLLPAGAGLVSAALLLTKINVGVFLLAGTAAFFLLNSSYLLRRGRLFALLSLPLLALPWLLMRPLLSSSWVFDYATTVCLCTASILLVAWPGREKRFEGRSFLVFGAAFTGLLLFSLLALRLSGTSWRAMLDGLLLSPLRMPSVFTNPLRWREGALLFTLCSFAGACLSLRTRGLQRVLVFTLMRLGLLLVFVLLWCGVLDENLQAWVLCFGLSLSWCLVAPMQESKAAAGPRVWLGLLLVLQSLHAYPVAGSQLSWGTFLWIPLLALACAESLAWFGDLKPRFYPLFVRGIALALPLFCLGLTAQQLRQSSARYRDSEKLALPGAESLMLPASLASSLQVLDANAREHASVLFTLPGMLSFNLRTGVPAPTLANATHWFSLLSPKQQEEIRTKLEATPKSCVIVENGLLDFLRDRRIPFETPLGRWLKEAYVPAFKIDSFEFWIRRERSLAPVLLVSVSEKANDPEARFELMVRSPSWFQGEIAGLELASIQGNQIRNAFPIPAALLRLLQNGEPRSEPCSLPRQVAGALQWQIRLPYLPPGFTRDTAVLRFLDKNGNCLLQARFESSASP